MPQNGRVVKVLGGKTMVQGQTQVQILGTAIYPYRGEIQFWSKFLRALENSKSRRNLNSVRALNPIERMSPSAQWPIGSSAWAHERIGGFAHRRIGTGTLNGNGNRNPEREREH